MKNAIVYIDYENIHQTLLHKNTNVLRIGFFEKLRKWCNEEDIRILDIIAYCNFDTKELSESYHQTKLQEYGVQTIHTSNKGKNYADLKITTDLLENMYNNSNVDGFILVSNDKDMTPLINQVKKYKDFMYLITAGSNYDNSILSFPDKHISIEEIENVKCEELIIDKMDEEVLTNLKNYLTSKIENINTVSYTNLQQALSLYC